MAVPALALAANPALKHDGAGVLGVSGPNAFHLTLRSAAGLDKSPPRSAGRRRSDLLKTLEGNPIRTSGSSRWAADHNFKTNEALKSCSKSPRSRRPAP